MATATMQLEIDVATNFLLSFAYSKLPRSQADAFKRELTRTLLNLYSGHWYPNNPNRGSAYRSLSVNDRMDPSIQTAAQSSGIDLLKLREHLPKNMTMWIDPYEVSYRVGERGDIKTLWEQQKQQPNINRTNSNMEGSLHYRETRRAGQQRMKSGQIASSQARWFQPIEQENEFYVGSPGRSSPPSWSQWSTGDMSESVSSSPYHRSAFDSRSSSPSYSSSSLSASSDDDSDNQHSEPVRRQPYYVTYRGEVYNAKALRTGYMPSRNFPHADHFFSSPRREITVSS